MIQKIDKRLSADLAAHVRMLGISRWIRAQTYERCVELPLVVSRLEPLFAEPLRLLDVGSGDSTLPSYLLARTPWAITCVDKFSSVNKQTAYAKRVVAEPALARLTVRLEDFLDAEFNDDSFDLITVISVIEHFPNETDRAAMGKVGRLLRPGGRCLITTPINEGHYREFYFKQSVYGEDFKSEPVFFQRHHDRASYEERVVAPSCLREAERLYFGDYGFQFKEVFANVSWPWKPIKALYQWAYPALSRRFASYRDYPVSRHDMEVFTASGVFSVLVKP